MRHFVGPFRAAPSLYDTSTTSPCHHLCAWHFEDPLPRTPSVCLALRRPSPLHPHMHAALRWPPPRGPIWAAASSSSQPATRFEGEDLPVARSMRCRNGDGQHKHTWLVHSRGSTTAIELSGSSRAPLSEGDTDWPYLFCCKK